MARRPPPFVTRRSKIAASVIILGFMNGRILLTLIDVSMEGRRRWLGDAKSDGDKITFYGTGEGGIWTATSVDGKNWTLGPAIRGTTAADPGAVQLKDGALLIVGTGPPRPGTASAQRRKGR